MGLKHIEGLPIENAKKALHLIITEQDVQEGNFRDPEGCVIARSCVRNGIVQKAKVYISTTYIQVKDKWYRYRTPQALQRELVSFDRGGEFYPGKYKLIPVSPSHQSTGRRQGTKGKGGIKEVYAGKRPTPHVTESVREHAPTKDF